jgi:hypothetical protein
MYKTTRNIAGDTFMTCKDCGHAISMNKICERPIQAATDILKHMAAHNASRSFAAAARVMAPKPAEAIPVDALLPPLSALQQLPIASDSQLTN